MIGGQLFSKSLRGLTVYKLELLGGEGLAMAGGIMLLPLVVLYVLVKVLPPWPKEETQGHTIDPDVAKLPAAPVGTVAQA